MGLPPLIWLCPTHHESIPFENNAQDDWGPNVTQMRARVVTLMRRHQTQHQYFHGDGPT